MRYLKNEKLNTKEVELLLSKKLGAEVKIISSDPLGGGCINNASKIDTNAGTFFLKWNHDCEANIFLREAESLEELRKAASGQLCVPKVFAAKKVGSTPGFLVLEYLNPGYANDNSDELLGQGLAIIHKCSADKFGFNADNYCGATPQNNSWKNNWAEFFGENRLRFLLELIQKERPLPSSEVKTYDQLLKKIPVLVPEESSPSLIHGDLWSGNYMHTVNGPALIDPASYYADREMEMGIMTLFGGFSQRFYDAYNSVFPLPHDWEDRNLLYQLYHVLNHYYLFGGGYRSQALQIAKKYI
ncbi:fructosamine kinase family protein [Mariniphaga anaerophila]|nr:fructosamine kinase family protein [Mariniphaga anaerophila]